MTRRKSKNEKGEDKREAGIPPRPEYMERGDVSPKMFLFWHYLANNRGAARHGPRLGLGVIYTRTCLPLGGGEGGEGGGREGEGGGGRGEL